MPGILRDILLSFCPEAARRTFRPESSLRTLHAATWTGLLQFLLMGYLATLRYKSFFAVRAQQLAPHIAGEAEKAQAGAAIFVTLEFLLYPVSILLLYLALEGFVRFVAGLVTSEIVPSLPAVAAFRLIGAVRQRRADRRDRLLAPDRVEGMPGDRVRIATARPRPAWNKSITIGIGGRWYEVEAAEEGTGQHPFVYVLRPAPASKIMRGYEEYDAGSALHSGAAAGGAEGPPRTKTP